MHSKKFHVFFFFIILLSGCISQGPTEEEKFAQDNNLSEKAKEALITYDNDDKISAQEETFVSYMKNLPNTQQDAFISALISSSDDVLTDSDIAKIGAVVIYKDRPFFDELLENASKDPTLLDSENLTPLIEADKYDSKIAEEMAKSGFKSTAEYKEAIAAGLKPVTAFSLSGKLKAEERQAVYESLRLLDDKSQIEAARIYGVTLNIAELQFLSQTPYEARIVLQDGLSEAEKEYIQLAGKFEFSKYLLRGALKDDNIITEKDITELKWFEVEYPKMGSAMKSYFELNLHPEIGAVEYVGFTEGVVHDPRVISTAPEEVKYIIGPGKKIVIHIVNPGDYIDKGIRYLFIFDVGIPSTTPPRPNKYLFSNPAYSEIWFFDNPLIAIDGIDHTITSIDGKWYIIEKNEKDILYYLNPYLYYYYKNQKIDIGYKTLIEIPRDGYKIAQMLPEFKYRFKFPDMIIWIFENGQLYDSRLDTYYRYNDKNILFDIYRSNPKDGPLNCGGWIGCSRIYSKNGHPLFGTSDTSSMPDAKILDLFVEKALPWLSILKKKYNPI